MILRPGFEKIKLELQRLAKNTARTLRVPDEVGAVAAERRLFEEPSDERMLLDDEHVPVTQSATPLNTAARRRRRRRGSTGRVGVRRTCRCRRPVPVDVRLLRAHHPTTSRVTDGHGYSVGVSLASLLGLSSSERVRAVRMLPAAETRYPRYTHARRRKFVRTHCT